MMAEWSKYETYYIYDKPIPYKNLILYPALMRDYLQFFYFSECLIMDKNSIPDVKIIGMSYLDYMYSVHTEEQPYIAYFDALLKIVLRKPDLNARYGTNENGKPIFIIDDDIYNAQDFDEITVTVNPFIVPSINIRNVVTPNGDGFNDFWMITGIEDFPDTEVHIINIYGQEVYQSLDYQNDWGGTYKGKKLPNGTYHFVVILKDVEEVIKGNLTLLGNE